MSHEQQYIVLRVEDVEAIDPFYQTALEEIQAATDAARLAKNLPPLRALVIEHNWPEYRAAKAELDQRIKQENCEHDWTWHQIAGEGKICKLCYLRDVFADD